MFPPGTTEEMAAGRIAAFWELLCKTTMPADLVACLVRDYAEVVFEQSKPQPGERAHVLIKMLEK